MNNNDFKRQMKNIEDIKSTSFDLRNKGII